LSPRLLPFPNRNKPKPAAIAAQRQSRPSLSTPPPPPRPRPYPPPPVPRPNATDSPRSSTDPAASRPGYGFAGVLGRRGAVAVPVVPRHVRRHLLRGPAPRVPAVGAAAAAGRRQLPDLALPRHPRGAGRRGGHPRAARGVPVLRRAQRAPPGPRPRLQRRLLHHGPAPLPRLPARGRALHRAPPGHALRLPHLPLPRPARRIRAPRPPPSRRGYQPAAERLDARGDLAGPVPRRRARLRCPLAALLRALHARQGRRRPALPPQDGRLLPVRPGRRRHPVVGADLLDPRCRHRHCRQQPVDLEPLEGARQGMEASPFQVKERHIGCHLILTTVPYHVRVYEPYVAS
jgi:hypothetical protein